MQSGHLTIYQNISQVAKNLEAIIAGNGVVNGHKTAPDKFQLYSKSSYGDLAMIDKHDFYIYLKLVRGDDFTKLRYRIRGNQTFLIIGVVGILFLLPVILILGSQMWAPSKLYGIYLLLFVTGLLGFVIYYLVYQTKVQERKAYKILLYVVDTLETFDNK